MPFALEELQIFVAKLVCIHELVEMRGVFICFYARHQDDCLAKRRTELDEAKLKA